MRLLFAVVALIASILPMDARSLTPCPISGYTATFEVDSVELTREDVESLDALLNRARQCNIEAVVLWAEWPASNLTERRIAVLRNLLVAGGINESLIGRDVSPDTANFPQPRPAYGVTVLVDFR
jgi:hypothetical protein